MPPPPACCISRSIHHVINRGNQRLDIFNDDRGSIALLETLTVACARTDWQIHACFLMRNHFHLVMETPAPNLVAGMKLATGEFTPSTSTSVTKPAGICSPDDTKPRSGMAATTVISRLSAILENRWKDDPGKVKLARRLRPETSLTLAWVAACLRMGS